MPVISIIYRPMKMRTFGVLLCCLGLLVSLCLQTDTLAQNQPSPPQVKQLSVAEIVESLNKTSFPKARIGLKYEGPEDHLNGSDSMESMALNVSRLSEDLVFSSGFTVESFNGCRLTLKNDDVKILNWGTSSYDRNRMSFAKFVLEPKKGEKKLTPQTGVLTIPLDKLSYKKGKPPHRYTKLEVVERRLGMWRVDFQWSGFFKLSIVEMEITAAEGKDLTGKMTAQKLNFFFDDKKEGDDFNVAFRQAIKLCSGN